MSKEETPPIIRWLHRYIFRGLGWCSWQRCSCQPFRYCNVLARGERISSQVPEHRETSKGEKCQLPTNEKSSRLYFS
jgi:hypothetical protein